jgi:hypothetical protein
MSENTVRVDLDYMDASAKQCHTRMAKAMRKAVFLAKLFGARWW